MKKIAILALFLAGCATTLPDVTVRPLTGNEYITYMAGYSPLGAAMKVKLYEAANKFCAEKGKVVETLYVKTTDQNEVRGEFASAELRFTCR